MSETLDITAANRLIFGKLKSGKVVIMGDHTDPSQLEFFEHIAFEPDESAAIEHFARLDSSLISAQVGTLCQRTTPAYHKLRAQLASNNNRKFYLRLVY